MSESPTPRTDAEIIGGVLVPWEAEINSSRSDERQYVPVAFARELERELERAREALRDWLLEAGNIINAERFNRERFMDDAEFINWAQNRLRYRLNKAAARAIVEGK